MAVPPPGFGIKTRRQKIRDYLIIRTIGNFLLLVSLFGVFANLGSVAFFETKYYVAKAFDVAYSVAQVPQNVSHEIGKVMVEMRRQNPTSKDNLVITIVKEDKGPVIVPVSAAFSVVIPKIQANENVVANVDPSNSTEYLNVLRTAVAHAKGTAFPGMNGTSFLFAHSTDAIWNVGRYNAVFYLLNKMEIGDDVVIFYNGDRYNYKVTDTKIIEPTDVEYLDAKMGEGERVILQTCYPPGTAWKRLLVFADRVK